MECGACGAANPPTSKFCAECGARLEVPERHEERKVVTVLFADLVGFTSRSEQLDVEDVRGTLAPFHARLRQVLESFGGTVEKFIGDAVMAVFGAPVAHEDDAERAVRAGSRSGRRSATWAEICTCASGSTPERRWCRSAQTSVPAREWSPAMW